MKGIKGISVFLSSFIIVITLAVFGVIGSKAASDGSSDSQAKGPAPDLFTSQGLAKSYVIDFLAPENAPDKTIYIKDPKGEISATWECEEHGHQVLTNVSFDGEVLSFNALSGTPGDEYFYFKLNFFGDFLLGYAKTQEGPKSPVVAKAINKP